MDPLEQRLAEQALKGLALRIERATSSWATPLTAEESRHIALSLLAMATPIDLPKTHAESLASRAV